MCTDVPVHGDLWGSRLLYICSAALADIGRFHGVERHQPVMLPTLKVEEPVVEVSLNPVLLAKLVWPAESRPLVLVARSVDSKDSDMLPGAAVALFIAAHRQDGLSIRNCVSNTCKLCQHKAESPST